MINPISIYKSEKQKSESPFVVSRHTLSWLDHAEKHFSKAVTYSRRANDYDITNSLEEYQMYLCIMSHVGMFDSHGIIHTSSPVHIKF